MANTNDVLIRLDGVKWWIGKSGGRRIPVPLCPRHTLQLTPTGGAYSDLSQSLECAECDHPYKIPRIYEEEKKYVLDKMNSRLFKQMKTINLDDEAVPLAKGRIEPSSDSPYWIEAKLVESRTGLRLVVYAGEKGRKDKNGNLC